jgi:hypothetical protein
MTGSESHRQHDQQDWLAVAGFSDENEAGRAASTLQNRGIPSMIDQRMMSANFVLLVSALELEEARGVLREADIEIVDPDSSG